MKKFNLKFFLALMVAAPLMFLSSCKDDEGPDLDQKNEFQPVFGENFEVKVDGNDVTITTTMTGNVWATVDGTDYQLEDQEVTIMLPTAGTYEGTVSSLGSGATLTSEPFEIKILQDNLDHLDRGLLKNLSGGANETKTWRMDINDEGKSVYFDGPLYYSGQDGNPYWSWDVLPEELPVTVDGTEWDQYFNWAPAYKDNEWLMAAKNYGTITFDATNGTVSTTKFGETAEGSFSFDTTTWKMTLTGVTPPIDTGRVNEGQFLDEDLHNLRIYSLSDSAMQIGVKRSFEGGDESKWVHVYNFVVVGYDYPEPEEFTPEEAPETSITASDLVGTWKFGDVPMGWIAYTKIGNQGTTIPARLYEKWDTRTEVVETLTGWGLGSIDSVFTAQESFTYVFNSDGTCTLNGEANTYTVSNGIITFGTPLQETEFNMQTSWLNHTLTGTEVTVVDVNHYGNEEEYEDYTPQGIWIGQQNDEKPEYKGFQLVKQE